MACAESAMRVVGRLGKFASTLAAIVPQLVRGHGLSFGGACSPLASLVAGDFWSGARWRGPPLQRLPRPSFPRALSSQGRPAGAHRARGGPSPAPSIRPPAPPPPPPTSTPPPPPP